MITIHGKHDPKNKKKKNQTRNYTTKYPSLPPLTFCHEI